MVLFAKISFDTKILPNYLHSLQVLCITELNVLGMVLTPNERFFHPRIMHPLYYTVLTGIEKFTKTNVQKDNFTSTTSNKKRNLPKNIFAVKVWYTF